MSEAGEAESGSGGDQPGEAVSHSPQSVKVDPPSPHQSQGLFVRSCFTRIRHSPERAAL